MRVQRATHIILLVLLVLTAGAAETRQEDRRQAQGTLSNMEEHQAVQLGTASWQSVRASSFLNQLKHIRLRLKDTAALLARQPPASAMKNLTPNQEKQGNINITPPPQRTLALAQQRTNDISNDVISLVSQFQQEAEQNSNSENLRNLGELKSLQSQMQNALHAAGMKTSSEKVGAENQGLSGQFDRKGETIGDLSAQAAPAPPAFVPQVTEAKPQQQMDESDVIHQIDEQISRLDKIQQVAGDSDRAPRSKAVESSGVTEKVAAQSQRNDFLSKESTFVNQSSVQSDGGAEDGSRYDNIQEQLRLLQEMLPKIEDAGQRAGLLQQFAPKIEDQMNSLEQKIQNEEKSSEGGERSPLPGAPSRRSPRQAPQPQPISVPAAVQSPSPKRAKKQQPVNKLHQSSSKQKQKKTEDDSRDDSSDIDRKIEETKAKIEQAKDDGNTAEAEDGEEDETVIFSSRKANARQTPSSSSDEPASSYHEASSTRSTGGSAKAASEEEEQGAGSTAQSSNPIESSIQEALKIKKDEMHHKKDKNPVESSIQQALRIKELEGKIARLEDKQKSNAQIISQQNMMQQLVMPSIISLSQRVMDMEKQSKGGSDHGTAHVEKMTSATPMEKTSTSMSSGPQQFLGSSARPNSMMQRVNNDEKSDQDEAGASNDMAEKLESLNEGLQKIVHAHAGEKLKKKRKDKKKLQQKDIGGGSATSADSARADQAKISKVMELVDRIKKIVKGGDGAGGSAETTTATSSDYLVPDQITEQSTVNKMTDIAEKDDGQQPELMASSKSGKKVSKQKYQQQVREELDLADKQAAAQNEFVKSQPMKEFEI